MTTLNSSVVLLLFVYSALASSAWQVAHPDAGLAKDYVNQVDTSIKSSSIRDGTLDYIHDGMHLFQEGDRAEQKVVQKGVLI